MYWNRPLRLRGRWVGLMRQLRRRDNIFKTPPSRKLTYRSADGWLEAATQIAHRSNGSPSQFGRAGVGGTSTWCLRAMDHLVAGSRDVAAHLDARCIQRLGHSFPLVHASTQTHTNFTDHR